MNRIQRAAVRAVLPVTVFVAVVAFHFVWLGVFPEKVTTEAACGDECLVRRVAYIRCRCATALP